MYINHTFVLDVHFPNSLSLDVGRLGKGVHSMNASIPTDIITTGSSFNQRVQRTLLHLGLVLDSLPRTRFLDSAQSTSNLPSHIRPLLVDLCSYVPRLEAPSSSGFRLHRVGRRSYIDRMSTAYHGWEVNTFHTHRRRR